MTDKQIKELSSDQGDKVLAVILAKHFDEVNYLKSTSDLSEADLSNLLAALKATLRTLAGAQVLLGMRHKDAGVALRKARQQRVATNPSSKKVVLSAEEFEAYQSYKDSLVSSKGSKE
jgi:hypothetical protein